MAIREIKRDKGTVYRVRIMRDGQKYDETFKRKYDAIQYYYYRRQVIASNPMSVIGRLELDEQVIRFWTRQEVNQFLAYTEKRYQGTDRYAVHLLYKVVLHTGMRFGEAQALAWSSVDFENRLITVRQSYCNVSKVIRETTKSGKIRNRCFYRDMRESGVSRIRFHDLRHTFASHFMMNGGNIYTLQTVLGHSDIKMTSRYAHLAKTHFRKNGITG